MKTWHWIAIGLLGIAIFMYAAVADEPSDTAVPYTQRNLVEIRSCKDACGRKFEERIGWGAPVSSGLTPDIFGKFFFWELRCARRCEQ